MQEKIDALKLPNILKFNNGDYVKNIRRMETKKRRNKRNSL